MMDIASNTEIEKFASEFVEADDARISARDDLTEAKERFRSAKLARRRTMSKLLTQMQKAGTDCINFTLPGSGEAVIVERYLTASDTWRVRILFERTPR